MTIVEDINTDNKKQLAARHPYYKYDKLYSYNGTYNFLVTGRGFGKTFGAKAKVIKDALFSDDQFIYLRRYKGELAAARSTFFADITYKFPNHDFKVIGNSAQASPKDKNKWKTIGFFVALSTAQSQKSVAFPNVKTIIFDEFIIEKGNIRYLPNEDIVFNNFYSTVDRYTDKTKVLFLANSVSIMNPYFLAYDIMPDEGKEFIVKKDGFIVAHFPDATEFNDSIYQTKFGKFIKDSDYAEYAVENAFKDNSDNMLEMKDGRAHYQFTLETARGTFSIWHSLWNDKYYIQSRLPARNLMFTIVPETMDNGKVLLTFSDKVLGYLRTAFRQGNVYFDNPVSRNAFTEIFRR